MLTDLRGLTGFLADHQAGGMTAVPSVPLHNGVAIPQLGLGTARLPDEETRRIVGEALDVGYRFVDTAAS
jgi:hypothetical protein